MGLSIRRRELHVDSLSFCSHPLLERIYRARDIHSPEQLDNQLKQLTHYQQLKGCDVAASLLADAIQQQKRVVIIGDFDADGATSTAICMLSLGAMGLTSLSYLVPNRFDFGYGLSPEIVDVAHQDGAQVIVTVDNGIACLAGVQRAKSLGMTVIITDHHLPGEQLPDADAIVNPNQPGCHFPSKNLAGVGVAFYLMLAIRAQLQQREYFKATGITPPNLAQWLDIVAVGTVADVVPLDHNNRILVHQGLQRIRAGQCRPGISAMIDVAGREARWLTSSDLGFVIGPRLNAAGRLEDMALGIECLLAADTQQAQAIAIELDRLNQQRRTIESEMKAQAETMLNDINLSLDNPPAGLVLYEETFHQGVIGIVAGRLKEQFQRPVIVFAKQDESTVKGSARSITGVHIRDVLEDVNAKNPELISKFGGHAMAAGLSIPIANLASFEKAFVQSAEAQISKLDNLEQIGTDGELLPDELSLPVAKLIRQSGPFGQGFEAPLFDGVFRLVQQRIVGQKHLKMTLVNEATGEEIDAIAFNIDPQKWPANHVNRVQVVYRLDVNVFRGRQTLQLLVEALEPYEN